MERREEGREGKEGKSVVGCSVVGEEERMEERELWCRRIAEEIEETCKRRDMKTRKGREGTRRSYQGKERRREGKGKKCGKTWQ